MLAQYDEDLQNNLFYKEILRKHQDIVNKVVEEGWIICIPRAGSTTSCITIDDVLDHILVPDIELPASHYSTLSKQRVVVQNKIIKVKSHSKAHNVQILFEETFYNADMFKYTVWCIEQPLNGKICCDERNNFHVLVTLQDCIEFLCINAGDSILSQIQVLCQNFMKEHADFTNCSLNVHKESIQQLLSQCIEDCCKKCNCQKDVKFLVNFKLAIETYMQSYLKNVIVNAISACVSKEEAEFNRIVQNLSYVEYQDLEISALIGDRIFEAKCELNKINKHSTVLGKLACLRNTFDTLSQSKCKFTSDVFLQILVYLIIKLQINNWLTNLKYITEFRFTASDVSDESSFLIASLEAAILYIKNGSIYDDVLKKHTDDELSVLVKNSDLEKIDFLLKCSSKDKSVIKLCHPLCSCSKCEGVLEATHQRSTNEKGQSLLHLAIFYNKVDVVEFLVEKHCDVNAIDNFCETPLHYAAKKGYQNILLFLVQSGAKTDEKNSDGNTALHLAVKNAHERCVKALIYSSKTIDVNAKNNWGNTPLHMACKWGYLTIVNVLIEAGALTNTTNYSKLTPKDVALNYFVCKALQCDKKFLPQKHVTFSDDVSVVSTSSLKQHERGVRPKNTEQQKKLDLLLKAIENNDAPLTCFYLGFPNPSTLKTDNNNLIHHPLCSCEHCQNFLDSLSFEEEQQTHCNVNMCNAAGYTPLHIAAKHGRSDILRLLLDAGATVNAKTYESLYTPLHLACIYQKLTVVKELLKCGDCNVDVQDVRGNTPLFYACCKNDVRVFELLLAHGADAGIKNFDSVSVVYEAERKMLTQFLKLLKGVRKADDGDELFT